LSRIASLPFVTFVRRPSYAFHRVGSVTSEGDSIHLADVGRAQFGVDGTGVKVAAISDGLRGLFAKHCTNCQGALGGPIASGDLPDARGTRDSKGTLTGSTGGIVGQSFASDHDLEGIPFMIPPCGFDAVGAEGTALLEIVHDLAPGAQLAFGNADTSLA